MEMDLRAQRQLVERVAHLERRLTELETGAKTEVRTGRVVVVDDHGFERIILASSETGATILVRAYIPGEGDTTGVEIYATDNEDSGEPDAGVCFLRKGDAVNCWQTQ